MKSRILLIALMTAIILSSGIAFAAKVWGGFDFLTNLMGQKDEKVVADVPYQDILDTPAPRSRFPGKAVLNGITMAGKRIVCVGQLGHVVYSDDGGKNWTQAGVPVSSDLLAVHFPTPQQGWAVGHDGVVLHSADGGTTWSKQFDGRAASQVMESYYLNKSSCTACHSSPELPAAAKPGESDQSGLMEELKRFSDQGADKPFLDVWFENENTGYIIGAFSLIFRTNNGGKSWIPLYDRIDNPKRYHLYSIRPVANELYLTAEQGTIFKLDPKSGRFKAVQTHYSGTFFGITGEPGAVIAFGMRGNTFRSPDGGSHWQKIETGIPAGLVNGTVTEDGKIVLVSQGGQVLVSSDNGLSFNRIPVERPTPAAAITSVDKTTVALVGPLGVKLQSIQ
ncbi:MAG: YCF48-related protein [Desulfuromonadaceae bacterium]|nr:YCF48-related protein [Desulfuromonadaceae bacterium]